MLRKDHTATVKGYARVSTGGEPVEAQHEALRQAGATQLFSQKRWG
jgi:DNA invertase Pin-like site-specific DNA recombinase